MVQQATVDSWIVDPRPEAAGAAPAIAAVALPGVSERILVILTTFLFLHETPNAWFLDRSTVTEVTNPILVLSELALIGIAFARIAGYLDTLIAAVRLEAGLYLFAGLAALSVFWSADPIETVKSSVVFAAVTVYGSYLVIRFSLDQIIRLLAVMFTISAAINLVFVLAIPSFGLDVDGRFTGVFGQKNALGYTAALAVPTLVIAARAWAAGRVVFYPAILIHLVLLIGSESKTMLVATLVPTASILLYHLFRARRTLRGAVVLGLTGSGAFTLAFATANIELLAQWLDKDVTLTGRVPLWESLLVIAQERPILGHGYGATFGGFFSPVHEVWIQNQWNPSHAHNALLQIWLEIGIVGALLYLLLYLRAVRRAIKIVAIVPGPIGLWPLVFLTTTLLVSITESGMTSELLGWMMLVVAVLSVSLHLRYRRGLGLSNDLSIQHRVPPPLPAGSRGDQGAMIS